MPETYLSLQEAADLSGKSLQTIRRAVKAKRVVCKRQKTPQGFNYLVTRESVIGAYKLRIDLSDRQTGGLKKSGAKAGVADERGVALDKQELASDLLSGYAKLEDFKKLQGDIEDLLLEHKKAKESFMRFMKAFQERFVVLENQLKVLEAPNSKKWYQFWK